LLGGGSVTSEYQNKKALFTDPNFSEGFALACLPLQGGRGALGDRLGRRTVGQSNQECKETSG
jgi:hypothetical protein